MLLALAVLQGCSLLSVGYRQIDTFAVWTADDYFDLEQPQRRDFLRRFDRLHEWHRYEQLPDYVAFLAAIRARVEKGLARDDHAWIVEGVKQRYRVIINRAAHDAAAVLATISPAQLDALQRRWDKVNRDFVREYGLEDTPEEQREARVKRELSRIRDWTGGLSEEQERTVAAMMNADEVPLAFHRLRYEDRLRRQREFLRLMTQRGEPRQFAERLRAWLHDWEDGRDPRLDRMFKAWERKQADIVSTLYRTLTPGQRATLLGRLQGYMDDFAELSKRPAEPAAGR